MDDRRSPESRVVRVFVSSTFRDMIADRDALMAQTWPALRKLCRECAVEFVEVDLRWGITEEQSRRKETVQYCLAEIRRCRPYFIGLLGERYGWVPPAEAFPETLLEEQAWLTPEIARKSATELEILHGVLNDPEMAGRAFFYFRDPAYAQAHGGDFLPEDTEHAERQRELKARIRTVCDEQGIPLREGDEYRDPERLAALVLEDLTAAIEAEYPADEIPDVWAREAREHESYAQSRQRAYYIAREGDFARLDAYAREGDEGKGLTLLGESGIGKSALLANWAARWRESHPDDFVFQHYLGSSPMSAGHLALMRRLMVAIIRWCAEPGSDTSDEEQKLPAKGDELVKVLPEHLGRLAYEAKQKGVRALIVLDALNQLEDNEHARLLAWLPYRFPLDLRLIVSTLPGDTLEALEPRAWPSLTVEPLTKDERVALIARCLAHFSRGLSEKHARAIADTPAAANPLHLKTLLDDLRATGSHRQLERQIAEYLGAPDIPALLVKILARYERDYERDHPGLVREALSLIWAARRGLNEGELLRLLKPQDLPQLPLAIWTPLRLAMEEGLIDRDGILGFGHDFLRAAVERAYVPDADTEKTLRLRLADDFEVQPVTARSCDELPWLLRQIEARDRLRACLLDIERFVLIHVRDENELLADWVWLGEERAMGQPYLDSFAQWESGSGVDQAAPRFSVAASQLGSFLFKAALYASAAPLWRRALGGFEQAFGPTHPDALLSLLNLAELLKAKGDLAGAEPLLRRALAGLEQVLGSAHPHTLTSVINLAQLLSAKGDLVGAEPLYRRALTVCEQALGRTHPETLRSLYELAGMLQDQGDLRGAEPLYRRATVAFERTLGPEYPDTLMSANGLAKLLYAKADVAGAEPLCRRALAGLERALGPAHPSTLVSVNNLAGLLEARGDLAEAEPLYRRALAGRELALGSAHPQTLTSVNNLAALLYAKGDLAGAEPLLRRALAGRELALGSAHPNTLTSVNNLAMLLQAKGDLPGAEPLYRRALAGWEQALGPAHPSALASIHNLASVLEDKGDLAGAESLYRRALAGWEQALGPAHPSALASVNNLANVLKAKGHLAEAEPLYRRALAGREQALGPAHPSTLVSVNNLAGLLKAKGDLAGAEPLYRQALAGLEQALGPAHPDTLSSVSNLAALLWDKGDLARAEPLYRRALAGREQMLGSAHPDTLASVNNLAALLRVMGRKSESVVFYRRVLGGGERLLATGAGAVSALLVQMAIGANEIAFHTEVPAKKWAEAEARYRQAIDLFTRAGDELQARNAELNLQTMFHLSGQRVDPARVRALTRYLEAAGDARAEKGRKLLAELGEG